MLPGPTNCGWTISEGQPAVLWMTLSEAAKICQELIRCGCNKERGCRGHCKCKKRHLSSQRCAIVMETVTFKKYS